jgi:hypothetical protein
MSSGFGPIKPWDVPVGSLQQDWILLSGIVLGQFLLLCLDHERTAGRALLGFLVSFAFVFSVRGLVVMYLIYQYNKTRGDND